MEMLKDFATGVATVAAIALVMYAIKYTAIMFGVSADNAAYFFIVPVLTYAIYAFGGLTRAIYFKKS